MLQALLDADPRSDGVLKGVETEAEGGVSVEDVVEELPALLDLERVGAVQGALVDGAAEVGLLGLSLAAADVDVESEDVVDCELLAVDALLEGLLVDDDLVAVDEVLLELVGEHALERAHLVGLADLLDHLGHLVVGVARLQQPHCSLRGLVGSKDHVRLLAGDRRVLVGLHHDGVGGEGSETVDVRAELELDEIALLDGIGILLEGRVIAADLVDGDGGRESQALEDRFFVIDLGELLVDEAVGPEAELEDLGADCDLLDELGEDV